jgi:hypothetical protein
MDALGQGHDALFFVHFRWKYSSIFLVNPSSSGLTDISIQHVEKTPHLLQCCVSDSRISPPESPCAFVGLVDKMESPTTYGQNAL